MNRIAQLQKHLEETRQASRRATGPELHELEEEIKATKIAIDDLAYTEASRQWVGRVIHD